MNNNKYKTNYQRRNYKNGISLTEIIISITIIVIMVAAISIAFLDRESEISLSLFRNQLISDLRYSQVKSVNSINNFGIFIERNNRYILFRDGNRDNLFSVGEEIRHIDLPHGIIFPSVGQNIVFQTTGSLPPGATDINISITNNVITKNILINSLGLIN